MLVKASTAPATPQAGNAPDTYVVVFNDQSGAASALDDQVTTFATENNAEVLYRYNTLNGVALKVPGGSADRLKELKNVKYIEKDIPFNVTLDKSAGIMGIPAVWDLGYTGKGVKVALIDTGIDTSHPDLKGKVVQWKDFVNGKDDPYDDFGHGTHCAGIIGGTGVASDGKYRGIAPEVQFIGVKVLGKNGGGELSAILKGIEYAANSDANVISMSLGSNEHSQAVEDMVNKAVENGKIVVVAAGNSGPGEETIGCPSDNPNVITVGATDKSDKIASFSSRGPNRDGSVKPDVTAPGKDIISTRAYGIMDNKAIDKYYLKMSGTSMAAPMVSGSIALLVQKDPKLTPRDAKKILEISSDQEGKSRPNNDYGYGRVNVTGAISYMDGKKNPAPARPPITTPRPSYPQPGYGYYPYPSYPSYPYPGYPYPGYRYPAYSDE